MTRSKTSLDRTLRLTAIALTCAIFTGCTRTVVLPPEYVPRRERTRVVSSGDNGFWGGAIFGAALLAGGTGFYLWKRNPAALAQIAAALANHLHSQATKNEPPTAEDTANNSPQGRSIGAANGAASANRDFCKNPDGAIGTTAARQPRMVRLPQRTSRRPLY
ncbi:hypothetical protein QUB63_28485 [Microcoleus sp. ARI1-B5]|uniref:hypothetical protein n=1 Tax=unclassified Microcoleus TaxID=2642155 RepID=UPI002FD1C8EB